MPKFKVNEPMRKGEQERLIQNSQRLSTIFTRGKYKPLVQSINQSIGTLIQLHHAVKSGKDLKGKSISQNNAIARVTHLQQNIMSQLEELARRSNDPQKLNQLKQISIDLINHTNYAKKAYKMSSMAANKITTDKVIKQYGISDSDKAAQKNSQIRVDVSRDINAAIALINDLKVQATIRNRQADLGVLEGVSQYLEHLQQVSDGLNQGKSLQQADQDTLGFNNFASVFNTQTDQMQSRYLRKALLEVFPTVHLHVQAAMQDIEFEVLKHQVQNNEHYIQQALENPILELNAQSGEIDPILSIDSNKDDLIVNEEALNNETNAPRATQAQMTLKDKIKIFESLPTMYSQANFKTRLDDLKAQAMIQKESESTLTSSNKL